VNAIVSDVPQARRGSVTEVGVLPLSTQAPHGVAWVWPLECGRSSARGGEAEFSSRAQLLLDIPRGVYWELFDNVDIDACFYLDEAGTRGCL